MRNLILFEARTGSNAVFDSVVSQKMLMDPDYPRILIEKYDRNPYTSIYGANIPKVEYMNELGYDWTLKFELSHFSNDSEFDDRLDILKKISLFDDRIQVYKCFRHDLWDQFLSRLIARRTNLYHTTKDNIYEESFTISMDEMNHLARQERDYYTRMVDRQHIINSTFNPTFVCYEKMFSTMMVSDKLRVRTRLKKQATSIDKLKLVTNYKEVNDCWKDYGLHNYWYNEKGILKFRRPERKEEDYVFEMV